MKVQGAKVGVAFARVTEDFLRDDGVELMQGGDGGDDDADILFEAGKKRHRCAVP